MGYKIELPSYERQNKWIHDYLAPIMIDLDLGKVIQNYRRNRREALRNDMAEAGVFESLERLENEGTSLDKVMFQINCKIESPKRAEILNRQLRDWKYMLPRETDSIKPDRFRIYANA